MINLYRSATWIRRLLFINIIIKFYYVSSLNQYYFATVSLLCYKETRQHLDKIPVQVTSVGRHRWVSFMTVNLQVAVGYVKLHTVLHISQWHKHMCSQVDMYTEDSTVRSYTSTKSTYNMITVWQYPTFLYRAPVSATAGQLSLVCITDTVILTPWRHFHHI